MHFTKKENHKLICIDMTDICDLNVLLIGSFEYFCPKNTTTLTEQTPPWLYFLSQMFSLFVKLGMD